MKVRAWLPKDQRLTAARTARARPDQINVDRMAPKGRRRAAQHPDIVARSHGLRYALGAAGSVALTIAEDAQAAG